MLLLIGMLGGCATTAGRPVAQSVDPAIVPTLAMFDGHTGDSIGWADLVAAMEPADVIILGESHNDATGHAVQLALVEEAMARFDSVAVSMEMLERDEQGLVDDYLDGIIDADAFAKLTQSSQWAGPGSWAVWYQPIIDEARDEPGATVIAANAPRRYVKLARRDGYTAVDELPDERRALVEVPPEILEGGYRDRFVGLMSTGHGEGGLDEQMIEDLYRAQLVWDATMASSIDRALTDGAGKVIHLVGQFHCDFDGGLVQQLRLLRPDVNILVVSLQESGTTWSDDDLGRGDVVVLTGNE